ncbi:hypothetical protein [Bdellovibrio sp. HCB337]|uniref:hypothetical protein n=1 Tax=Bdellovibrio sp. HCB337 TaxID=3394358 RepID=UPI0039A56C0C
MRFLAALLLLSVISCVSSTKPPLNPTKTVVEVVELKNLKFSADSFLAARTDLQFQEIPSDPKYMSWAGESVERVNNLVSSDDWVPKVKIKLMFEAAIKGKNGKVLQVPISIIDSYQEPLESSLRIGMLEMKDDKESFQLTVAHEYAHLVFENASRRSGVTSSTDGSIPFWPKPVYEGVADLLASFAFGVDRTASETNWSVRKIGEFADINQARNVKDDTVLRASVAFKKMGLIPKYPIYSDWLVQVDRFIKTNGGVDPYAEGRWFAGVLKKQTQSTEQQKALVAVLIQKAKSGAPVKDTQEFSEQVLRSLKN